MDKICFIVDKENRIVKGISPAFNLDNIYSNAAQWACGQYIPTALAQQSVWEGMRVKGFKVLWVEV